MPGKRLNKKWESWYTGAMITSIKFPPATLTRLQAEAEKSGKDLDTIVTEAVEAKPTKEFDDKMGNGDEFVRRSFESLWAYLSPDA